MTGLTAPAPQPAARRWKDFLVLALVLVVGSTLSVLAGQLLRETEQLRSRELRTAATQTVLSAFDLEMSRTIEAVRGAGLMVETQQNLSRDAFNRYAQHMLVNVNSINFLEWQPVVQASELRRFEAQAAQLDNPSIACSSPTRNEPDGNRCTTETNTCPCSMDGLNTTPPLATT